MCSEFLIKGSVQKSLRKAGVPVTDQVTDDPIRKHVRLYDQIPIVVMKDGIVVTEDMGFSLKPKGTTYATHNARLYSWDEKKNRVIPIFDKPTWEKPFITSRCLVPMSAFVEPIYQGDHAGQMVEFHQANDEMMFAAGIYASTMDRKTGEVYEGFALIMSSPSEFVLKVGHHREPIKLKPDALLPWISEDEIDPEWGLKFLESNQFKPSLIVNTNRTMAKGWEKRVKANVEKHEAELKFLTRL